MTHSKSFWIFGTLVLLIGAGCYGVGVTGGRCCPDEAVGASAGTADLPANVWAAAVKAVPGLVLDEWESETQDGVLIYDIEGAAYGQEFELEVTADGTVLEIEQEEADDKDDADDDDGEHDDDGKDDDDDGDEHDGKDDD